MRVGVEGGGGRAEVVDAVEGQHGGGHGGNGVGGAQIVDRNWHGFMITDEDEGQQQQRETCLC